MNKQKVIDKARLFFQDKDYSPIVQTDNLLIFESDERAYSLLILIVLFLCGIMPGIVYMLLAPKLQVIISTSGEDDAVKITVYGNTNEAKKDANESEKSIN
jgi:hypothetical protein